MIWIASVIVSFPYTSLQLCDSKSITDGQNDVSGNNLFELVIKIFEIYLFFIE